MCVNIIPKLKVGKIFKNANMKEIEVYTYIFKHTVNRNIFLMRIYQSSCHLFWNFLETENKKYDTISFCER